MSATPFKTGLRDWRKMTKLSQSQAAKLLDVPVRTLQEWEQGKSEPYALIREAVCTKMNLCLEIQRTLLASVRRELAKEWKKV